ncbi:amidohydrolase family protein [Myxococcota bacterium]|nr:amidohydrolase family protein [Myxococcota bacterium]
MTDRPTRSTRIREQLDHPVVDGDGHLTEFYPGFLEYVEKVGGGDFARRYVGGFGASPTGGGHRGGDFAGWADQSWEERRHHRTRRAAWWGSPTRNLMDAATTALPGLLYERMEELGMDYSIVYGGLGLYLPIEPEEETRRITVRALNTLQADMYREYADRLTPVACIPMHTPEEAIEELEHSVVRLGHKVIMIPSGVLRPIPAIHETAPEAFPDAHWVDHYTLDSDHDYDPFWAKCVELKVAVTAHSGTLPMIPWAGRSISNFCFNHIGNHALHQAALCKALVMGGVTHRFPTLHFALLEGGAAWACKQFADLVGMWEKRSVTGLEATNPANLDVPRYIELIGRYGGRFAEDKLEQVEASLGSFFQSDVAAEDLDEWAAMALGQAEDFVDRFASRLFFGCEADDASVAWAFDTRVNPFGARLKAVLGSDIGHFDVPDMAAVIEEAYELRERELLDADEFRDFAFANAVRLHGGMNPDFFVGTAVEEQAAKLLAAEASGRKA